MHYVCTKYHVHANWQFTYVILTYTHWLSMYFRGLTIADVQGWIKKQAVNSMDMVDCGGQSLDPPQIAAIEKAVEDVKVHVYTFVL